MNPTYAELKAALGIRPTAIDTGFHGDFGPKYEESHYLPGKQSDRRKLRPPAGEDLSHLNCKDLAHFQRIGRAGGRRAKK